MLPYLALVLFFISPFNAMGRGIMELTGSYSYQKQVYGTARDSKYTTQTMGAGYAWYIFSVTGIELNYTRSTDKVVNKDNEKITDTDYSITETRSTAETEVYGVGLRQALLPVKSLMVPSLSFGYAREKKISKTVYALRNDVTQTTTALDGGTSRTESNSAYGTFSLKFNFAETFSINASVTTVFRAFKWEEAKYNVKYFAGFSWYF